MLSHEPHGDMMKAVVKMEEGRTTNDLLSGLIANVEVHAFKEIVPGMNDIFISLVNESNQKQPVKNS